MTIKLSHLLYSQILIRQGGSRRGHNVLQEGYGSATVLPEQGIYLAASIYRPVLQVLDYHWNMYVCLMGFPVGLFWPHILCSLQIRLLQCCQKSMPSLGKLKTLVVSPCSVLLLIQRITTSHEINFFVLFLSYILFSHLLLNWNWNMALHE